MNQPSDEALIKMIRFLLTTSAPRIIQRRLEEERLAKEKEASDSKSEK
ncbi:hypothetical protein ACIQYS_09270 [Psychrobacillus sp. NPDC096426]